MQHLLQRAKHGDRDAEEQLIGLLLPRFLYLATRRVGADDAPDIAQDACVTVIEKYREYGGTDDFLSWAYMILKNKIGNYYQARSVRKKYLARPENGQPSNSSHNPEPDMLLRQDIRRCLKKLLERFPRYAAALHYSYEGYATPEICQLMSVSTQNLYVILNRGRSYLSSCLQNGDGR
jgi:RNA polymerase sigma factor (sigma-70 family)